MKKFIFFWMSLLIVCVFTFSGCTSESVPNAQAPTVGAVYEYDVAEPADVRVLVDLKDQAVGSVWENGAILEAGTDYTYGDGVLVIDQGYFSQKQAGDSCCFVVMTLGGSASFTVEIVERAPTVIPKAPVIISEEIIFDLTLRDDVRVNADLGGEAISLLTQDGEALEGGTEYTYADKVIVLGSGLFAACAAGDEAEFTVTTAGGSADFTVQVIQSDESMIEIRLSETEATLTVGDRPLTVTAAPSDGISVVTWSNSNPKAVDMKVNANTVTLTGISAGTATIVASLGTVRARLSVTVEMLFSYEYDIVLDGDLSDWESLDGYMPHTISIEGYSGEGDTYPEDDAKSATFYAVLTEEGLYAAVESYHDLLYNTSLNNYYEPWWYNTQFEVFVGENGAMHYFVFADAYAPVQGDSLTGCQLGMDNGYTGMQAYWLTKEWDGGARYKTIVETFIPYNEISDWVFDGAVRVGLAWKSKDSGVEGDTYDECSNGACNDGGPDRLWIPAGASTNEALMPVADERGVWLVEEYWT